MNKDTQRCCWDLESDTFQTESVNKRTQNVFLHKLNQFLIVVYIL